MEKLILHILLPIMKFLLQVAQVKISLAWKKLKIMT